MKEKNGFLEKIIEKPEQNVGNLINIGLYSFTPEIFEKVEEIEKSERGEYEVCDAIKDMIIKEKNVGYNILEGTWIDAGTFDNLYLAATLIKNWNKGIK